MQVRPFKLERYLARWEFGAEHFLSASDCESMTVGELLNWGGGPADALLDLHLGYTESEGDPLLRERIGTLCEVDPARVLVTNAPEEGIFLIMAALVRPGDRVLVQSPCYQSLFELGRYHGGNVECWPLQEKEAAWSWDLDQLEWLLEHRTRLVVVNLPHNPTGFQASLSEFEALVDLCARHGAWLFIDQMYRGLERSPEERLPFDPWDYPKAISLWGMSKSFGLPGLRIGWLASQDPDLFETMLQIKDYTTICCSAPSMLLARLALEQAETLMERSRGIIAENISLVEEFLASTSGETFLDPAGGRAGRPRPPPRRFRDRILHSGAGEARYPDGSLADLRVGGLPHPPGPGSPRLR